MAMMGMIGGLIGGVFSLVGSIASANAQRQQAAAERNAAQYNAQVQEQKANEERAAAQRKALQTREKKDLALSQLQARAAFSGGGAGINDPTVISLATDIEEKGEYQALGDMFVGESRGRSYENQANLDRYIGETRARASKARADATIMSGIGGLFSRFG